MMVRERAIAVVRRWGPLATVAGVVGVAGSFAVAGFTVHFVAAPVNAWVVEYTPGVVVTVAILSLGSLGEVLAFAVALVLSALALAAATLVGASVGDHAGDTAGAVLGTYFAGWTVTALLVRAPFVALGAAVPMALVVGVGTRLTVRPLEHGGRRRALLAAAGLCGFLGLSTVAGLRVVDPASSSMTAISSRERARIATLLDLARERSLDVDGLEGLITPVDAFYEVDIDAVNPNLNAADWQLRVTGAVEAEQTIGYDDLTSVQPDHRFVTLRCVGEPLNGTLMDTALWTGVPAADVVERARPLATATHVILRAADGYDEEFPVAALRDGFLAYGMNGQTLPRKHGFPVRALIPGHWGEIQVKWLTEIEFLTREALGYWERRGWHGTGPVNTVAKLHVVNYGRDGSVQIGGHAYAGDRGIDGVEVSTDGGATWQPARLGESLPDEGVWRQWVLAYDADERHDVVVRAIDGTGAVQPGTESGPYPSGATGWVRRQITPPPRG